jgi:predicted PurR-regulated permease PerM
MSRDARTPLARSTIEAMGKSGSDTVVESVLGNAEALHEDVEIIHASLKAVSIAQVVIAFVAIVALLYFLRYVFITSLCAMLAAFILEPLVAWLASVGIPRAAGSILAVLAGSLLTGALGYFLLIQVEPISRALPQYSNRIKQSLSRIQEPINRLERSAQALTDSTKDGDEPPLEVRESPTPSRFLVSNFGTIGEFLLAFSFLPCLTYFMLTWKNHVHRATVMMFPEEHRLIVFRTVARISGMIRSFLIGNLVVWLIGAVCYTVLFWCLGIPFFYFIGFVCGFLSLIPSVGAILAAIPPVVGGMGILHMTGFLIVVVCVFSVHVVMLNLLYPKLVGKRVLLNPLAVVLALLFWAWLWGAIGLILAIPMVAAVKIVCDHTDSWKGLGAWLGI